VLAAPLLTVVNTYTAGSHGQPPLDSTAGLHHVLNSGVLVAMVMLGLGIVCVGGEYRHGTIVATLLAEPRRRHVLLAKTITLAALGAMVAAVGFALAVAAAVPSLALHDVHRLPSDLVLMFVGAVAEGTLFAVIGVALGAITRSTVAAIVAAITWVAVVEAVILHAAVPSLARWLPSGTAMALDRTTDGPHLLPPAAALATLALYAAALTIVAVHTITTRDAQ
jgi:ABC-type transport system involved in multi-copper enzyme maturation permease subunit